MNYFKYIFCSLLILSSLFPSIQTYAGNQNPPLPIEKCDMQIPYGKPVINMQNSMLICRNAYLLQHDNAAKIPVWVVYTLTSNNVIGCVARSNAFRTDQSLLPEHRSTVGDYAGSGYDTGHMAPAGDMSWSELTENESFILSNTSPQTPELNRGAWKTLETAVRSWSYNNASDITIYTGPIYDVNQDKKIGPNGVIVPHAFYKIVIDNKKRESLAFVFENNKRKSKDLSAYQVTVKDVEIATNIEFPVPDSKIDKHDIWTINTILLSTAKKKKCDR